MWTSVALPEGWRREGRRGKDSRAVGQGGRGREGRRPGDRRAAGQGVVEGGRAGDQMTARARRLQSRTSG